MSTLPNFEGETWPTDRRTARVAIAPVVTSVDARQTPADVLPLEELQ